MPDRIVDRINVGGEEYHLEPVIDASPVQGSVHAVSSGGVWQALQDYDIFANPVLFNKVFGRDIPKVFTWKSSFTFPQNMGNLGSDAKFLYYKGLYVMYGTKLGIRTSSDMNSWSASGSFAVDTRISSIIEAEGALWGISDDTTYKGIWYSTDAVSWVKIPSLNLKVYSICYLDGTDDADSAFLVGTESGIYRSTDSCATFSSVGGPNSTQIGQAGSSAGMIFAGSGTGLWQSADFGRSWARVSAISSTTRTSIPVYSDYLDRMCVATASGIYYSDGSGSSFTATSMTDTTKEIGYNGYVFVAGCGGSKGLYWSFDAINWNKSDAYTTSNILGSGIETAPKYRNGVWVVNVGATGDSKGKAIWSTNGINWNECVVRPYNNTDYTYNIGNVSFVNGVWAFISAKAESGNLRITVYTADAETLIDSGFFGD